MVETTFELPWMNPLPSPYQLPYWKYSDNIGEEDEIGNAIPIFEDMALQPVQGWDMVTREELEEHEAGETFDVFLRTAPDFWPGIKDRFSLPISENQMQPPTTMFNPDGSVAAGVFEVVGHIMEGDAFHRWRLTNMTKLKRMSG